jgi:cation transport regulator ChaC
MSVAVFAYGSLVSPASAAATLGRSDVEAFPATLAGRRRSFTLLRDNRACEKTFARRGDDWVPDHVLALNIAEGGSADSVNGALLAVSEAEVERLDLREIRYRRVEVSALVAPAAGARFDRVFAYVARPEHHAAIPPPEAVVLTAYERAVEEAFARLGERELERYRASTDRGDAERIDAYLLNGEIPAGNPRRW